MTFTHEEKLAIFLTAKAMVLADGKIEEKEMSALLCEMQRIGVTSKEEYDTMENEAQLLEKRKAQDILKGMSTEKKKYVCAFLGAMIYVDGDANPNEKKLWSSLSAACDFPVMSIGEAFRYMASLNI